MPVGLNYDRVLEDRTLLRDLDPGAPARGPLFALATTGRFVLRNLWLALANRWHRFGYACVRFGPPLTLRRLCAARGVDPAALDREALFDLAGDLGADLMAAVAAVVPVVPVPLVADALLAREEADLPPPSRGELEAAVRRRAGELRAAGAYVHVPRGDEAYAVEVGLRMLVQRGLVAERDGRLAVVAGERPLVAYYARSIRHLPPAASRAA